jgi:hypothetical protein
MHPKHAKHVLHRTKQFSQIMNVFRNIDSYCVGKLMTNSTEYSHFFRSLIVAPLVKSIMFYGTQKLIISHNPYRQHESSTYPHNIYLRFVLK